MEDFYTAQASRAARAYYALDVRLQAAHGQACCSSKSHREAAAAQWASLACLTVRPTGQQAACLAEKSEDALILVLLQAMAAQMQRTLCGKTSSSGCWPTHSSVLT